MSEFYRCSICGNPMFAGYLCPKCSANGLKSCEVKTTNWQEQETIAELQKRIDELEEKLTIKTLENLKGASVLTDLKTHIAELEAQLAQVAKENDWMKYPESPESGAK